MKIALLVLGGFILLVGMIALIGAALPRTHRASRQAFFSQCSAFELYRLARDFSGQPSWNSTTPRVEMLPDENGRPAFRVFTRHGAIAYRVLEDRPGEKLVTEIADEKLPFGGRWIFEFSKAASGQGATLRITEDGEVKNVIFRFLARFVFGYTVTMETYLRDLGKKIGEPAVIEP